MGKSEADSSSNRVEEQEVLLRVDDRGRVTLPKEVRERLGIEPNDEVPATLIGTVLEVNPEPSSKLETATAGREDWTDSTPTDAGEALFGPMEHDDAAE